MQTWPQGEFTTNGFVPSIARQAMQYDSGASAVDDDDVPGTWCELEGPAGGVSGAWPGKGARPAGAVVAGVSDADLSDDLEAAFLAAEGLGAMWPGPPDPGGGPAAYRVGVGARVRARGEGER